MRIRHLLLVASFLTATSAATAQSAAEHIALGDQAHATLNASEALGHYEAAIEADPDNYEALWKGSRDALDIAEFEASTDKRNRLFRNGEQYARRALAVQKGDAEAHFCLARALGKVALTLGSRERVKYAKEVRSHALEALMLDPNHPGALHVMGRWHAEVMRLNSVARFFARNFLGGDIFNSASWKEAVSYMERSVQVDPDRLTHHLDLGDIYADINQIAKALARWEFVLNARVSDFNDPNYKRQAADRLKSLS